MLPSVLARIPPRQRDGGHSGHGRQHAGDDRDHTLRREPQKRNPEKDQPNHRVHGPPKPPWAPGLVADVLPATPRFRSLHGVHPWLARLTHTPL